jgi:hypothetical protein
MLGIKDEETKKPESKKQSVKSKLESAPTVDIK